MVRSVSTKMGGPFINLSRLIHRPESVAVRVKVLLLMSLSRLFISSAAGDHVQLVAAHLGLGGQGDGGI